MKPKVSFLFKRGKPTHTWPQHRS